MKTLLGLAAGLAVLLAGLMGWGYWFASTHAALDIGIEDLAQDPQAQIGTVHGASLELLDADGRPLAPTRSVEAWGYQLAQHPRFGDCTPFEGRGGKAYSDCFTDYAAWASGWAMRTRFATVRIGACVVTRAPVALIRYDGDWPMWWFPLQHGSGKPLQYIQMRVKVDSRRCIAVA